MLTAAEVVWMTARGVHTMRPSEAWAPVALVTGHPGLCIHLLARNGDLVGATPMQQSCAALAGRGRGRHPSGRQQQTATGHHPQTSQPQPSSKNWPPLPQGIPCRSPCRNQAKPKVKHKNNNERLILTRTTVASWTSSSSTMLWYLTFCDLGIIGVRLAGPDAGGSFNRDALFITEKGAMDAYPDAPEGPHRTVRHHTLVHMTDDMCTSACCLMLLWLLLLSKSQPGRCFGTDCTLLCGEKPRFRDASLQGPCGSSAYMIGWW